MQESRIPRYRQIEQDILEKIQQGVYGPETKLPSENQMSDSYKTSVPTVRKALAELVHNHWIYRVKGSGTYVCDRGIGALPGGKAGRGRNICFLVFTDVSDSSIMKMIRGAQACLFARGYNMSILCRNEETESECNLIHSCHDSGVDGIIYFAEEPETSLESFHLIRQYGIPAVMLDRGPRDIPYTLVAAYNVDGGYRMAQYLLGIGHRRIAFAVGRLRLEAEGDRLAGYRMALQEAGIPGEDSYVVEWWKSQEEKERLTGLVKEGKVTAIQCVNDKIAAEIMRLLQQEGCRIPEDVSVAGFDDWDETEYMVPRITTVFQPFEQMGKVAAERLLELLEEGTAHSQTLLPVTLKIKDSCCPPHSSV